MKALLRICIGRLALVEMAPLFVNKAYANGCEVVIIISALRNDEMEEARSKRINRKEKKNTSTLMSISTPRTRCNASNQLYIPNMNTANPAILPRTPWDNSKQQRVNR
ncbi:hypothetical protein V8C37DRAFT_377348 [Trichoderma ceciliae]